MSAGKDGRTRLAYKPEHAVDLDTGVVLSTEIHHADKGDTTTLSETLDSARTIFQLQGRHLFPPTKRK